jgi:L-arabinose isomerase
MDFMNLNQAAHGDREFGYIHGAARGTGKDGGRARVRPAGDRAVGTWARAAAGLGGDQRR